MRLKDLTGQKFGKLKVICRAESKISGGIKGFEKTKRRDEIKNAYCKTNNIPLLRLPYTLSLDEIKEQIYEYYLSVTTAGCA